MAFYVKLIIQILKDKGFDGWDSQCEQWISDENYDFKKGYYASNEVTTAYFEHQPKHPILSNKEKATAFWLELRDKILAKVVLLNRQYPNRKLDYTPESLKDIEWMYYDYLDKDKFDEQLSKKEFYTLLSYYKAKVYVENRKFIWLIKENIFQGRYDLAIQSRGGRHTIILGDYDNLERFRDKRMQRLWKDYKRMV